MVYVIAFLGIFVISASFIPYLKHEHWWIRVFDFPRLQIAAIGSILLIGFLFYYEFESIWHNIFLLLLIASLVEHTTKFYPYTSLHKKQVLTCENPKDWPKFSLVVMNVLMSNRNSEKARQILQESDADIVLMVEVNQWWREEMKELEDRYPYHVLIPLENTYGMFLYSRLKIVNHQIRYLLQDDVPSISAKIKLPDETILNFFGVHPRPPAPGHSETSTNRDAELIMVGKETRNTEEPVLVAGDLNDVAWSYTTNLFQKYSELLDPRIGRGLYNTFHAKKTLLKWPLDHVFHSDHFQVLDLHRLDFFDSDHFPIYLKLCYIPSQQHLQEEPEVDGEELEDANDKVDKAKEEKAKEES